MSFATLRCGLFFLLFNVFDSCMWVAFGTGALTGINVGRKKPPGRAFLALQAPFNPLCASPESGAGQGVQVPFDLPDLSVDNGMKLDI